jgi:hypothetical protein
MPKAVEEDIRASVKAAHPDYDEERVNQEVYSVMNKQGLLNNRKRHGRRNKKERR